MSFLHQKRENIFNRLKALSFGERLAYPALIGAIPAAIVYKNCVAAPIIGITFTVTYTTVSKIFDNLALNFEKQKTINASHQIHCHYAIKKLDHAINSVSKLSSESLIPVLDDLETILNNCWKNCPQLHKENYEKYKGIVGDSKEILLKRKSDKSLNIDNVQLTVDLNGIKRELMKF